MSSGVLTGVDPTSASLGVTLSLVDNELVSFTDRDPDRRQPVRPDRPLSRHERQRARCARDRRAVRAARQTALATYDIPPGLTGQTVYFKFQSFNAFGGGVQDSRDCAVYTIVIGSAGTTHPIAIQLQSGVPVDLGQVNVDADHHSTTSAGSRTRWATSSTSATSASCRTRSRSSWRAASPLDLGPVTVGVIDVSDDFGAVVDPPIHTSDLGTVP